MPMSLPDDVFLLVGDYLEDHQDRYNLVFVCHRFQELFLRLVYRSAVLKSRLQAQSFLAAILRRPELARAVRALEFRDWRCQPPHSSDEDLSLITNWTRTISPTEGEHQQWVQDLQSGLEEAWIALSLPLVPNLRKLLLVYPRDNKYLDRSLERAAKGEMPFHTQPALRKLREVALSHQEGDADQKGTFLPAQILPFFQLPSMQVFSADAVLEASSAEEPQQEQAPEAPLPGISSISDITLNTSNGHQGMQRLVESCRELKVFKYQHSDSRFLAEGYQPSAFYQSLAGSKKSLETLWLDTCGEHLPFTVSGANESHDEWFGSLADFTALKDIRIRLPNLLDIRYQSEPTIALTGCLPASVESLYVEGCKESSLAMLVAQLTKVLNKRPTLFRALHRLDIEGCFHDEEDEDEASSGYQGGTTGGEKVIKPRVYETADPLRVACVEAGIELHLRDRGCVDTMR